VVKWCCLKRVVMQGEKALFDGDIIPASGYASEE
jgi:phosphoribosylglycinamide formyltransferase-1